ncbi:MAG: sulfite exporter TauE/SafE family protein [Paracoccaceae bacterium]|nr:sulfite exporter TauE/SafE family protein [Paracoccaceae bacterium]
MTLELLVANAVIFVAAVLQAATGIGFAMVAVPLLALINLAWIPAPMLICNIVLSVILMSRGRAALDPTEGPPLVVGLTLGTFAGAGVLTLFDERWLGVSIGAIIVVAVTASLATPPIRINRPRLLAGATLGGATGIISAMHGPPLVLLYQRERPEKVRATMAGVFIFGSLLALGSLWLAGFLGWEQIWRGLILLPGVALGYLVGRALGGRMTPGAVRYAMLGVSGAAGLALLIKSL